MDPKFDKNFASSPLDQSKLYHEMLTQIMATQLAGSSKPLSARVTVTADHDNPDVFRIFVLSDEDIGEIKKGRSYYSRSVPGLLREHFETPEGREKVIPHLKKFLNEAKEGEVVLFDKNQYEKDLTAFFKSVT